MTIWHHHDKQFNTHSYYTSLTALMIDNEGSVGVSKYTLDRHNWSIPYEDELCVIRKGTAINTRESRGMKDGLADGVLKKHQEEE